MNTSFPPMNCANRLPTCSCRKPPCWSPTQPPCCARAARRRRRSAEPRRRDLASAVAGLRIHPATETGTHRHVNTLFSEDGQLRQDMWDRGSHRIMGLTDTLGSAIAALLANGQEPAEAAREAQEYLFRRCAARSGRVWARICRTGSSGLAAATTKRRPLPGRMPRLGKPGTDIFSTSVARRGERQQTLFV